MPALFRLAIHLARIRPACLQTYRRSRRSSVGLCVCTLNPKLGVSVITRMLQDASADRCNDALRKRLVVRVSQSMPQNLPRGLIPLTPPNETLSWSTRSPEASGPDRWRRTRLRPWFAGCPKGLRPSSDRSTGWRRAQGREACPARTN